MTLKHLSLQTILSFSAMTGFGIGSQDVNQAYTQSDEPLGRPIYLEPLKVLMLSDYVLWKLVKTDLQKLSLG